MALIFADRVKETTTTTGTGTLTLAGAATGYQSFAAIGNGNQCYYAIIDSAANTWEVGYGTYTSVGTTLSRTTVFSNSLGTTALVNFVAGVKDVICTQAAWSTANISNFILGYQAGNALTSINNTTAIGYQALKLTSGSGFHTVYGALAASNGNILNNGAVAYGGYALYALTGGTGNTALGTQTLQANTNGINNTAVGTYAGFTNTSGENSTYIGYTAGYTGAGFYNTAVGSTALYANSSGTGNVAVGYQAGQYITALGNTMLGYQAGAGVNTGAAAQYNVAVGYQPLTALTTAQDNIAIGRTAGQVVSSGGQNILIGFAAGKAITTGDSHIAIGREPLGIASGQGTTNIYIGYRAGYTATSGGGSYNMCLGYFSGLSMAAGQYNVILGGYGGTGGVLDVSNTNYNVVISDNNGGIKMYTATSGLGGFNVAMAQRGRTSTASTGTINYDVGVTQVQFANSDATANFTLNIRASASIAFNTDAKVTQPVTLEYWNQNGATAYYMTALTIDGAAQTVKWFNGTAPTAGNANSIDKYTFTIFKIAGSTYTVLGKLEKFA